MSHTPGPWKVEQPAEGRPSYSAVSSWHWRELALVVTRMHGADADHPEGLANARLIAAAPDLLSALRNAVWILEHSPALLSEVLPDGATIEERVSEHRAVIAKAEGRA